VTLELKRPAAMAGILISVFAGLVAALLWLLPKPFTRFEYLITGTAATGFTLLVLFLVLTPGVQDTFLRMFRKKAMDTIIGDAIIGEDGPRTVRRSEQSS
jgi:hypothetical protein